jgi:hypothetical protein
VNAPERAPDWWRKDPWPLPAPMTEQEQADAYQQEQIDSAKSAEAFAANVKEHNRG